jgi:hypothetical protein
MISYQRLPQPQPPLKRPPPRTSLMTRRSISAPIVALMIAATIPTAKTDAELGQRPVANKGSYDPDHGIADESKPGASHDLARQEAPTIVPVASTKVAKAAPRTRDQYCTDSLSACIVK